VHDISELSLVPLTSMQSSNHDFFVLQRSYVRHIFQACPVWIYTQSNAPINVNPVGGGGGGGGGEAGTV
jgi:hypothetical protein